MARMPRGLSTEEKIMWHGWTENPSGCWIWGGTLHKRSGYAILTIDRKVKEVHRLVYELWVEQIENGNLVRHSCDVRSCINPKHLLQGTYQDNMNDKMVRGRYRCLHGEDHKNAKLKYADVAFIRQELEIGVLTQLLLAESFNVSETTISNIKTGRIWKRGSLT